jgi:molybdenum cofactor biosynthesis protein B
MGPQGAADAGRICECITGKSGVRGAHMPPNPRAVQCPRMAARTDLEHKATSPKSVGCYVVTVSDTRTEETDTGGRAIVELLTAGGHRIVGRSLVRDDPEQLRDAIGRQLANPDVQVIITTGGTGITSRDCTFEAVSSMLWKRLDGFGELFRMLSYEQIGSGAMMSRALAGIVAGRIIVSLPGSEGAVRLALEKLLVPELGHLVREATR